MDRHQVSSIWFRRIIASHTNLYLPPPVLVTSAGVGRGFIDVVRLRGLGTLGLSFRLFHNSRDGYIVGCGPFLLSTRGLSLAMESRGPRYRLDTSLCPATIGLVCASSALLSKTGKQEDPALFNPYIFVRRTAMKALHSLLGLEILRALCAPISADSALCPSLPANGKRKSRMGAKTFKALQWRSCRGHLVDLATLST